METHQKDIEEKDPFGQNRADEADDDENDEKSFLKALLAERALKNSITLIITSIRLLLEEDDDDTEIKTKDDENRNETIVQIENVSQPTLTEIDPNNELKLDIDY